MRHGIPNSRHTGFVAPKSPHPPPERSEATEKTENEIHCMSPI